ncbi:MAG TPA: hypothetical protein PLD20_16710 [Blastocatellia bacterium]|nr:hypothetical protein [Blastocatellia bacterium]HMZ19580.1 hypothetical protein [Blastocatellia bacterium]
MSWLSKLLGIGKRELTLLDIQEAPSKTADSVESSRPPKSIRTTAVTQSQQTSNSQKAVSEGYKKRNEVDVWPRIVQRGEVNTDKEKKVTHTFTESHNSKAISLRAEVTQYCVYCEHFSDPEFRDPAFPKGGGYCARWNGAIGFNDSCKAWNPSERVKYWFAKEYIGQQWYEVFDDKQAEKESVQGQSRSLPLAEEKETPLDGLIIIFTREFSPKEPFVNSILTKMNARGRPYCNWMTNDTPMRTFVNPKAQDPTTFTAMAMVQFRLLIGNFDMNHVECATFESNEGVSGIILSHWKS